MNLVRMSDKQRLLLRKKILRNLYPFCRAIMGFDDITEALHGKYCSFLEGPGSRKQATMPRSFVKTWIGSIAFPVWASLVREKEDEFPYDGAWNDKFWQLGPNMRILIASYVISNAEKMIGLIKKTYESNTAMQILFPEVIPQDFTKTKWSNESACINRGENFTESTFEAAGIGGAATSRHYDLIIEDDLIYAKKDDLSGGELQPGVEDIEKAIGWHKIATSLLVPGKHTRIHNVGTRWAKHDLVDYIWRNEPTYKRFIKGCVNLEELEQKGDWRECTPEWSESYDIEQLKIIADAQGPYMFATQYLLKPMAPEDMLFRREWLQFYNGNAELPKGIRKFTTVDLAGWGTTKRSRQSKAVILTCGWDSNNHVWLLHYDVGRFDPSEVIEIIAKHHRIFHPEIIGIEEVYYQKSLAHFARKMMEEGKIPRMRLRPLKPEGKESKDLRIRALEPIASNLALHIKPSHKEFIEEFCEYVPNNDVCRKDMLDALAYQIRIARPGAVIHTDEKKRLDGKKPIMPVTTIDEFLDNVWEKNNPKNIFGQSKVPVDPYGEEVDWLAGINDPFYED